MRGQVFSWGLNSHGQLGLGKGVPLQPIPALVRSLTGVPVIQVAAGGTHTLALTLPGLVYCCGANRAGQLGLNRVDEKGRFNICAVPALRVLGVSFISCGEAHSAVLTKVSYYYCGEGHCCSHQELLAPESEMFMYNDTKTLVGSCQGIWDDLKVELDPENRKKSQVLTRSLAFNQSAEKVFEEFRRGFFKVCDRDVVEFFQPEELRGVMVGKEDYDWDTFKQNTVYDGEYHARHPNIVTFWEAFEELTDDQKKAFLLFLTGCDRVPILGMDKIQMTVAVLQNSTELHFPESLTCHFLLLLPIYPSKEMLLARLKEAVAHNRGFWKE
nr:E3 ISG15--protein ligase Herc6-like [Salvelinus alpinus]